MKKKQYSHNTNQNESKLHNMIYTLDSLLTVSQTHMFCSSKSVIINDTHLLFIIQTMISMTTITAHTGDVVLSEFHQ